MSQYVLDHHLEGEKKRLALMSQLLDPMHRRYIESLGISRDARVLEVACGNGSMSAWMAGHVAPDGQVVAIDLDLALVNDALAPGVRGLRALNGNRRSAPECFKHSSSGFHSAVFFFVTDAECSSSPCSHIGPQNKETYEPQTIYYMHSVSQPGRFCGRSAAQGWREAARTELF